MYYPRHNRRAYRMRRKAVMALQQMGMGALGGLLIMLLLGAPLFLP